MMIVGMRRAAQLLALLAAVAAASPALARGGYTARPPTPVCGWSGGALADPAATQACLARRFKAGPAQQPPAPSQNSRSDQAASAARPAK